MDKFITVVYWEDKEEDAKVFHVLDANAENIRRSFIENGVKDSEHIKCIDIERGKTLFLEDDIKRFMEENKINLAGGEIK